MKDFTNRIYPIYDDDAGLWPVTFILSKAGYTYKLNLVKAIKDFTQWGLKDCKDFVDESSNTPVMFRMKMRTSDLRYFKEKLSSCDNIEYYLDDVHKMRSRKLISLGIADRGDISSELSEIIIHKILNYNLDFDKTKSLIQDILSNFDDEKLKEIYNKYESNL